MGRKKRFGRSVNGVIVIDKPAGMTSNDVVQQARRLFFASKAGHTGSLDPLATGVLPVCFGEATKFSQYLLDADKEYVSEFVFGISTNTADSDGETVRRKNASGLSAAQLEQALANYRGVIQQMPPMYSALKKNGQPLYKLARQGIEVERQARPVTIHHFELLAFEPGEQARAQVNIRCSKGTYVRSLAEDLGRDLGVGGHVGSLHRTQAGPYSSNVAHRLEDLQQARGEGRAEVLDHHLLPVDSPVTFFPELHLEEDSGFYFGQGQAVMNTQVYRLGDEGDTVRVFLDSGPFLGLGRITDDGRVTPKRLVAQ